MTRASAWRVMSTPDTTRRNGSRSKRESRSQRSEGRMSSPGVQTKSAAGISFEELLRHNEEEAERWHEFFRQNPGALDMTVDMAQSKDVRSMLVHIMAVEL